jgi:C4-dicarboxylate-specific signal transduction histidine kinase
MSSERMMPEMAAAVGPGAAEWLALSDDLLAGLVHSLNNRVTAIGVCAELAGLGDEQMLGGGMLQAEVARLQKASALVALLPARGHAEALEIGPVLHDAVAIHAHHPRMRVVECAVEIDDAPQPVRAPRWALMRVLLMMVDAAKAGAHEAQRGSVVVRLSGDAGSVRVRAAARDGGGTYAAEMATVCGGTLAREAEELVLTMPSLTELRRQERAGRLPP